MDPRFEVSFQRIYMPDLTEEDEGSMAAYTLGKIISLVVLLVRNTCDWFQYHTISHGVLQLLFFRFLDCEAPEIRNYKDMFSWIMPNEAEYFQFTPLNSKLPIVLWNRTGHTNSRGTVNRPHYEIPNLTQKDSGYYKFRGSENQLLKWTKLVVKGKAVCKLFFIVSLPCSC